MKRFIILLTLILFSMTANAEKPQTISASQTVIKEIDKVVYGWYKDKNSTLKPLNGSYIITDDDYTQHGNFVKGVSEGKHTFYTDKDILVRVRDYQSGHLIHDISYYEDGTIMSEVSYDMNGAFDGMHTVYYENGSVEWSLMYLGGVPTGDYKEFHPDGKLKRIIPMNNGVPDGELRGWDDEGRLVIVSPMKEGKIDGQSVMYVYNTRDPMKNIQTYSNDTICGDRFGYYIKDGDTTTMAYHQHYIGTELVSVENFDTNGSLDNMGEYKDGEITAWNYYDTGILTGRVEYRNDLKNGKFIYYFPDGKLWKEGIYTDDEVTQEIEYDRSGKVVFSAEHGYKLETESKKSEK